MTGLPTISLFLISLRFSFFFLLASLSISLSPDSSIGLVCIYSSFLAFLTNSKPLLLRTMMVDQPSSDPTEPTEMSESSDVKSIHILQFLRVHDLAFSIGILNILPSFK